MLLLPTPLAPAATMASASTSSLTGAMAGLVVVTIAVLTVVRHLTDSRLVVRHR